MRTYIPRYLLALAVCTALGGGMTRLLDVPEAQAQTKTTQPKTVTGGTVDTSALLSKSGGTMTGQLVLAPTGVRFSDDTTLTTAPVAAPSATSTYERTYSLQRTLGAVGTYTEIGTFSPPRTATNFTVQVMTSDTQFAVTKTYRFSTTTLAGGAAYRSFVPLTSSGPHGTNDYELTGSLTGGSIVLRLHRSAGSAAAGVVANITIVVQGPTADTFVAASGSFSAGTPSTFHPAPLAGLYLPLSGGNLTGTLGLGVPSPVEKLEVAGKIKSTTGVDVTGGFSTLTGTAGSGHPLSVTTAETAASVNNAALSLNHAGTGAILNLLAFRRSGVSYGAFALSTVEAANGLVNGLTYTPAVGRDFGVRKADGSGFGLKVDEAGRVKVGGGGALTEALEVAGNLKLTGALKFNDGTSISTAPAGGSSTATAIKLPTQATLPACTSALDGEIRYFRVTGYTSGMCACMPDDAGSAGYVWWTVAGPQLPSYSQYAGKGTSTTCPAVAVIIG